MSDIKKMKIMYLNVNGFAGKKDKKSQKRLVMKVWQSK